MTLAEGQALVLKNLSCQFVASVGLVIVVARAILQGKKNNNSNIRVFRTNWVPHRSSKQAVRPFFCTISQYAIVCPLFMMLKYQKRKCHN